MEAVKTKNFDLEELGMTQEKLEKSGIDMYGEETSKYYHTYLQLKTMIDLFALTPDDFQFDFSVYAGGIYSFETSVRGKGFGQVMSQLTRAMSYQERDRTRKLIHQDFLLANKLFNKYKDLYGPIPKY